VHDEQKLVALLEARSGNDRCGQGDLPLAG
jgi:hypothetical protein